jgi:proteasome lid subunit RPN8/RPN11
MTPMETAGQLQALHELERIIAISDGALKQVATEMVPEGLAIALVFDFTGCPTGGVPLTACEEIVIAISADYPFVAPVAFVEHARFEDLPHVQWGRHICLYGSPNDWDPDRGIGGFLEVLVDWFLAAAEGRLEGDDIPWHPPVAYTSDESLDVVLRADLPYELATGSERWILWAVVLRHSANLYEVVDWLLPDDNPDLTATRAQQVRDIRAHRTDVATELDVFIVPVFGMTSPMTFEFPETLGALGAALEQRGVTSGDVSHLLAKASDVNSRLEPGWHDEVPRLVLLASPGQARPSGVRRHVIAAWEIDANAGVNAAFADQDLRWAAIFDHRPESTSRRDVGRPATWLQGKRVVVLGCGALGAPVAELCVRAGASKLTIVDDGSVHPGLLVRQPYDAVHVGLPKTVALASKLRAIDPTLAVDAIVGDVLDLFTQGSNAPDVDLIIDATANRSVATKIERHRWTSKQPWPPLVSLVLGHAAERGLAMVSPPESTGAGVDILRSVVLGHVEHRRWADVVDDFLPAEPRTTLFHPEPGCSAPTFVGSAADVLSIVAPLFNAALRTLAAEDRGPQADRSAIVIRPWVTRKVPALEQYGWENDVTFDDPESGYQIRLRPDVIAAIRREAADIARSDVWKETGGALLGHIDTAARVAWVTSAESPPEGMWSAHAGVGFDLDPVRAHIDARCSTSRGMLRFVGMWHTHPGGPALLSGRDHETMTRAVDVTAGGVSSAVLLILGGLSPGWESFVAGELDPEIFAAMYFP